MKNAVREGLPECLENATGVAGLSLMLGNKDASNL